VSGFALAASKQLKSFRPSFDQILRGALLLYIAFLPLTSIHFVERIGFLVLLALLVVWCVWHRRHFFLRTPIDMPLGMFVLWVGLTIPFASFPGYSLGEYGKLIKQVLIFYAVLYFFQEKKKWGQLVRLIVGVGLIVCLYGVANYKHPDPLTMTSFLPAEVWLSTYLVMMLPLCIALALYEDSPWAKRAYMACTLLVTCGLLLTQSRASLLAAFTELWGVAVLAQKRAMITVAGATTMLALVLALFTIRVAILPTGSWQVESRTTMPLKLEASSMAHRLDIWAFLLREIGQHPIVGIGYGKETISKLFGQTLEETILPGHSSVRFHGAHNLLLEITVHVGIPGLLLFIWLAVCLGKTIMTAFRQASDGFTRAVVLGVGVGMCGLAVRLMFDQMLVGVLAILFWILVAIAMLASGSYRPCADRGDVEETA